MPPQDTLDHMQTHEVYESLCCGEGIKLARWERESLGL